MSFGQGSSEKANDKQIQGITQEQKDIASNATGKGNKAFKWLKQSALPAKDFWSDILTGDRSKIMDLLGPEISTIKDTAKGQRESNVALTPRSGARASGVTASETTEASNIGDMIAKARPTAAEQLMNLAQLFESTSLGETGAALGAYNSASSNLFSLNKEQQDARATTAQFWGSLGQGAGSILGAWLLKPPA